jgi:hypothetical protein
MSADWRAGLRKPELIRLSATLIVIPELREAISPESMSTIGSMDSGRKLRAPRNDERM